jgi:hypothetical protein
VGWIKQSGTGWSKIKQEVLGSTCINPCGEEGKRHILIITQITHLILMSISTLNLQEVTSESSTDPIFVFINPNNNSYIIWVSKLNFYTYYLAEICT